MRDYHKRLLACTIAVAVLLILSTAFSAAVFHVDARQLRLQPEGAPYYADGLNRSSGPLPSEELIDRDGYDDVLAEGFEIALENDGAALYFKKDTAEIALMDRATGHIWYSNPQNRQSETMVEGTTRLRLGSQVTVNYYDTKGAFGQMDSYNDSIAYDGMSWEIRDGALLVSYRLGKTVVTLADVPQQISKSRMDRFTEALSEADREDLLKNYRLASVQGQEQSYIDKLKAKYPNVVHEDTYYLTKDSTRILKKIRGYLDQCGYTWDDLDFDNEQNQVKVETTSRAFFAFTLRYRLEERALVVSLLGDSLDYDAKIPPCEIRLLEYFGAGGREEKGYMLLPDGSGTLIYYNNGKTNETPLSMRIYGEDTVSDTESAYLVTGKASFPVFGVRNGAAGMLCTVEEGAALCSLNARVAGMQNSYNTAFVSYKATAMDRMTLSDTQQIYFENAPYRGDVTLRYTLLEEDETDYMGMAGAYRRQLLEKGWLREETETGYPLMLDYVCAVPTTKLVAGLSVRGMEAMTTYDEAAEITRLTAGDGANVWLMLEGWTEGGMEQKAFNGIKAEKALGGAEGLRRLAAESEREGWLLMPQTYLATAFTSGGFSTSGDCVRDLCRDIAVRYDYDYLNRYRRFNGRVIYQLDAERWQTSADQWTSGRNDAELACAAVADVGSLLYSDFDTKRPMNRDEMRLAQEKTLSGMSGSVALALPNPNAYALSHAAAVYDLPCSDSGFRVTDESVPFYQAVIHGSVDYAAPALNYADDYRTAYLQAVEFGAGLHYALSASTTALLKDTDWSYLNKGCYTDWAETIRADYARAASALEQVADAAMVGHARVAENVYVTAYDNGISIAVNYSGDDTVVSGVRVSAHDFAVIGGADR